MEKNMRYLRLPKKETVNHFAFFIKKIIKNICASKKLIY